MGMSFSQCLPMPAECAVFWAGWGTIASAAVGVVTVVVALLAWRTSRRAAVIANEATRIAEQQHKEAVLLREGTARILGSLLGMEVFILPVKLGAVIDKLNAVVKANPLRSREWSDMEFVLEELSRTFLPMTEEAQGRLHNLPGAHGDDLAGLVGMGRGLVESSRRLNSRFARMTMPNGQVVVVGYTGDNNDFESLHDQIIAMLTDAIAIAQRFAGFIGAEQPDYLHEKSLLPQ